MSCKTKGSPVDIYANAGASKQTLACMVKYL